MVSIPKLSSTELTLRYNPDLKADADIIQKIHQLINSQKLCSNCKHYQIEGLFISYNAHTCTKQTGNLRNLDWKDHPNHNGDGSKCQFYEKIES